MVNNLALKTDCPACRGVLTSGNATLAFYLAEPATWEGGSLGSTAGLAKRGPHLFTLTVGGEVNYVSAVLTSDSRPKPLADIYASVKSWAVPMCLGSAAHDSFGAGSQ